MGTVHMLPFYWTPLKFGLWILHPITVFHLANTIGDLEIDLLILFRFWIKMFYLIILLYINSLGI